MIETRNSNGTRQRLRRSGRSLAGMFCIAALLVPAVAGAQSISRVNASRMSCAALQDLIEKRGAVIVRSKSPYSNNTLSDRFASRRTFCNHNEIIMRKSVATADKKNCSLKYCTERKNKTTR